MASTALTVQGLKKASHSALAGKYLSAKNSLARLREGAAEKIEGVVKTLEIQAAAFAAGAIQGMGYDPSAASGSKQGYHLFGVPVEAAAGVLMLAGGLMGFGGDKWATHLTNFGNGALAAYSSNVGRGWGYKFTQNRKKKGGKTSGDLRDEISSLLDD